MRNYLQTSKFKKGQPKYTMMNKLGSLNSVSALSVVFFFPLELLCKSQGLRPKSQCFLQFIFQTSRFVDFRNWKVWNSNLFSVVDLAI